MSFSAGAPSQTSAPTWRAEVERQAPAAVRLDEVDRVVVLAAHPDDETLGAGGLVAHAHSVGLEVAVVVATHGEGSHPNSPTHSRERLAAVRATELQEAVGILAPGAVPDLRDWPDGEVAAHEDALVSCVVALVGDGRRTLVVAPWRHDGHPDHEAVGRAGATAAARTGARLLEYPVWFWHWARTDEAPWSSAQRLALDATTLARKRDAIAAHRSQVAALSGAAGDEALLEPGFLAHFETPDEVFWEQDPLDDALESLHRREADPWGVDHRFYEQRKRAIVAALLPRARFRRGVELGCSTGSLAEVLAERCTELVAVDASRSALAGAARRLGARSGVELVHAELPTGYPAGVFDLVVLSEVGYFLSPAGLDELARRVEQSLTVDGVVVLCHWRHPVVGWPLDGPSVHATLLAADLPPVVAQYRDRDVEVLVLSRPEELPDPHALD